METTIQVSRELLGKLKDMKTTDKESYEDIIWDLIEDRLPLSEETKRHLEQSRKEIAAGKAIPLAKVKKDLGL